MKFDWSAIGGSIVANKGKLIAAALGCLLLLGFVLWMFDAFSGWSFNRGHSAKKEAIANTVKEISNIQTQIANLEQKKGEKIGELKRDTEDLNNNIFGLEEAKKETNAAVANYINAVNSNSNVNRSAEDLEEILKKLEDQ